MIATETLKPGSLQPVVLAHFQGLTNNRKIIADFACASGLRMARCSHENEHETNSGKHPRRWLLHRQRKQIVQVLQNGGGSEGGPHARHKHEQHRPEMNAVKLYLAEIGALGGKAGTGKSKARTKAQARAAAKARWDKARALRQNGALRSGDEAK